MRWRRGWRRMKKGRQGEIGKHDMVCVQIFSFGIDSFKTEKLWKQVLPHDSSSSFQKLKTNKHFLSKSCNIYDI